jgi:hypothetical protein
MNIFELLTGTHVEAEAVTLLCDKNEYQKVAEDAFLAPVHRVDVRSHHNSDAPEDKPAVSVYFNKD